MKLNLIVSLFTAIVLSFSVNAQKVTVAGAEFPTKMKISDKVVEYNGAGLRQKYFFNLYVAALYVPERTSNAQTIIDQNEESAMRLKILSNKVTRDKFVETVKDGFATSTEGKASESEIAEFMKLFNVEFKEGDDIILIYKPSSGIEVYMNGKHLGGAKGLAFKKALWGIWLGKKPADASVKKAMLGKV
ncbi:chalcone isomerase [Brumimicrobium salinarum]|uniref:Chalcone isomerase n=1 Tax=Brumimicrobium salinarum TaxID=2058658 RepID=A0A2I0R345_9FLAO|nr:chalcone isomerase family protein [Brumimicrobium salinarum]PKR81001.1 chalcone isomerase [Brumimicrobium salinarum]